MVDEHVLQEESTRRRLVLGVLCLAQLVVAFDQGFTMIALPSVELDLGFAAEDVQWVVTAYAVAFGGSVLLGGRVADVAGRRRTLLAGLGVFALGAVCAGLAPDAGTLVAARALQGLGVGFIAPAAVSTLTTTFVRRRDRSVALGVWAAVGGLGTALGVAVGGVVTETVGWRWIGVIDLTIAAVAIAIGRFRLPVDVRRSRRLDLAGGVLVTIGLSAAVLTVSRVSADGWSATSTRVPAGLAFLFLTAFLLVERRVDDPLLPLGLVRRPCVSSANIVALIVAACVSSMMLLLTLMLQRRLGYTPGKAGFAMLVLPATAAAWALVASRVVARTGSRTLVASGVALLAAALASFARMPDEAIYVRDVLPGLIVAATGMAFAFVGLNGAALSTVPERHAGLGSGLLGTSQQVGAALGIAVLSAIAAAPVSPDGPGLTRGPSDGLAVAFWVDAVLALVAIGAALFFIGRADRRVSQTAPAAQEAVPVAA